MNLSEGKITTEFQPIISLKNCKVLGFEALSREVGENSLESPEAMFDFARDNQFLLELESFCQKTALVNARSLPAGFNIFINIDPKTLVSSQFHSAFNDIMLKEYDISPKNIVIEITEKSQVRELEKFKLLLDNYKDQGFKIAIDNAGAGHSGLKLITDVHPHFIKLDKTLVRDIDKSGMKSSLIKSMHEFCRITDIKLIAEGIESQNELDTLIDIGIDYGQGFFIQKPMATFPGIDESIIRHINEKNDQKKSFYNGRPSMMSVGAIAKGNINVDVNQLGKSVLETFKENPNLLGVPVTENKKVVGLIMKDKFFSRLGTQYGYSLFLNRPIKLIMNLRPLLIDYDTTIEEVSKLAMARSNDCIYDYIIVTKEGNYFGIITVRDLLEKTIELEVTYAQHLNPLTGLPGNLLIEQQLKELVKNDSPYTVLYIDIDNFKVYNDVYGFENGDRMLHQLGKILTELVTNITFCRHFVGHIGGDDFVLIMETHEVEDICKNIISKFEKSIKDFYSDDHMEKKEITALNRHGKLERFNLVSLSVAGARNKNKNYKDIFELAEHSSKVKHTCKEIWNSCYVID